MGEHPFASHSLHQDTVAMTHSPMNRLSWNPPPPPLTMGSAASLLSAKFSWCCERSQQKTDLGTGRSVRAGKIQREQAIQATECQQNSGHLVTTRTYSIRPQFYRNTLIGVHRSKPTRSDSTKAYQGHKLAQVRMYYSIKNKEIPRLCHKKRISSP